MTTLKSVWCPVMQAHVTCEIDLEGTVVRPVCYEYESATSTCRMKRAALESGPLGQFLTRVSENALADSSIGCPLA
jgi:hypothetical protein